MDMDKAIKFVKQSIHVQLERLGKLECNLLRHNMY
jgi:hypothetical protein